MPEETPKLHAVPEGEEKVKKNPENGEKTNWTQLIVVTVVTATATWFVTHSLEKWAERRETAKRNEPDDDDLVDEYGVPLRAWPGTQPIEEAKQNEPQQSEPTTIAELNEKIEKMRAEFADTSRSMERRLQRMREAR
jgi:hypothetical protein